MVTWARTFGLLGASLSARTTHSPSAPCPVRPNEKPLGGLPAESESKFHVFANGFSTSPSASTSELRLSTAIDNILANRIFHDLFLLKYSYKPLNKIVPSPNRFSSSG